MSPFAPRGERARWRIAYDLLRDTNPGVVLTYEKLGEALDLHPRSERSKIQVAVKTASQHLLEEDKRAIEAVVNEGYRVVDARGHLVLARTHHVKSTRELGRGQAVAVNVDLNGVDPNVRRALEMTAEGLSMLLEHNQRFETRQQKFEEALASVSVKVERTEAEIAELRAELRGRPDKVEA
jgi:hypothetical protein